MAYRIRTSRKILSPIYKAYMAGDIKATRSDISKLYDFAKYEGRTTEDPKDEPFDTHIIRASEFAEKGDYKNAQKALDRALGIGTLSQTDYTVDKKAAAKGRFGQVYIAKLSREYANRLPYTAYYVKFGAHYAILRQHEDGTWWAFVPYEEPPTSRYKGATPRVIAAHTRIPTQYDVDFKDAWRNRRYAPTIKKVPGLSPNFEMVSFSRPRFYTDIGPRTQFVGWKRQIGKTKIARPIKKSSKRSPPKKNAAKTAAKKQIGKTKITRPIKKTSRKTVPKSGGKYTPIKLIKK